MALFSFKERTMTLTNFYKPQVYSVALARLKTMVVHDDELALTEAQVKDLLNQSRVVDAYGYYAEPTRVWEPITLYALGDLVVPTTLNGNAYICTDSGFSGSVEPEWSDEVVDASAAWALNALHGSWTPTYNLSYAAYRGWILKAGFAASKISFSSEGAKFDRSYYMKHCQSMASFYAAQLNQSVRVG
jgi:hypothetical protein